MTSEVEDDALGVMKHASDGAGETVKKEWEPYPAMRTEKGKKFAEFFVRFLMDSF